MQTAIPCTVMRGGTSKPLFPRVRPADRIGAKAAAYVDAFMKTVSWKNANEAFRRASVA